MNAGTPIGSYGKITTIVEGIDPDGKSLSWKVSETDFLYRDVPGGKERIVTAAHLLFRRADSVEVEREIERAKEHAALIKEAQWA